MLASPSNKLSVELEIIDGKAATSLDKFKSNLENTEKTINSLGSGKGSDALKQFGSEISKVTKQTDAARKSFADIVAQRLDSGKVGILTRELVAASERSRQLNADIASIQRELGKPQKNSSILSLTAELAAAQAEVDQLDRKLNSLSNSAKNPIGASNLRLSSFQKTNLAYQANDVLTMAAMGANPAQILASQGGQIAQTFSPAQIAAFTAKYASLLTVLGAGTALIGLTYKITTDIRAEAERRLKVEERLSAEYGKQVSKGVEITKNYREQSLLAQQNRDFGRYLQRNEDVGSLETLISRKKTLEVLANVNSFGDEATKKRAEQQYSEALAIAEKIDFLQQKEKGTKNTRFSSVELFAKQREAEERLRLENAERFNKSVEKAKEKILEFQKSANSFLETISAKAGQNNPFVSLFSEADQAMKSLRENTKGLDNDLKSTFERMQQQQNSLALFAARLDNKLNVSELRSDAEDFRRPKKSKADEIREQKQFETIVRGGYNWNTNPAAVVEQENLRRMLFEGKISKEDAEAIKNKRDQQIFNNSIFEQAGKFSKTGNSTFNDLNKSIAVSYLAQRNNPLLGGDSGKTLDDRLEKQLQIIESAGARTPEEISLANRKIISLTQGKADSELADRTRDIAARARENEALRLENAERAAAERHREDMQIRDRLAKSLEKLIEIADKEGFKPFEAMIRIIDQTNGLIDVTRTPTPADMARRMKR